MLLDVSYYTILSSIPELPETHSKKSFEKTSQKVQLTQLKRKNDQIERRGSNKRGTKAVLTRFINFVFIS